MVYKRALTVLTCCRTCHTMQVVSLEPEIRWMPQWSVDKQVTMSGGEEDETTDCYRTYNKTLCSLTVAVMWRG